MDTSQLVTRELHKIHRSRNRLGYFPNLLAFFLSIYFQKDNLETDDRWVAAILCIFGGTLIRVLVYEVFFHEWEKGMKWARVLGVTGIFLVSFGWGLHFSDVYFHYGEIANNVVYVLLLIAALITGASTSLIGDKISYYTYVIVMSSFVVVTYLSQPRLDDLFIVANCLLYVGFSLSNFIVSHKQICELLRSKIQSTHENERLLNIINAVPGYVGLIDKDLIYYVANTALIKLYPDVIGKKFGSLDPEANWTGYMYNFLASDKQSATVELKARFYNKDMFFIMNVQKMEDGGAIIVLVDTTELEEARHKLREQEAKAQYSSKLASLGEMAAGIAHEVNNPLTIIQGSANILRRLVDKEPIDKENVKSLATKVIDTSERISKTIRSLKALSRNGENDPKEVVSIKKVIEQCLDISEQRMKKQDIELRLSHVDPELKFLGREVQMAQVMINLLSNAVDAIKHLPERWIEIQVERKNTFIDVYVRDSGSGIPVEIRNKIMDPFFTTKDVNQGTGLGLSISRTILKDHGGELTLLPDEKNTTFRIRLPVAM